MAQLAKIETAKVPATAVAGLKVQEDENVAQLKTDDVVYQRFGVLVLVLVFGVFVIWAALAPLGSYAVATGKVVVQTQNQVIQHREGGVIDEIFVKDGDSVEKGQRLIGISPTDAKAEKGIVQEQLLNQLGLEARLNAELEGQNSIQFPPSLLSKEHARAQSIIQDETQQFKVRTAAMQAESVVLQQRIQRLKEQLQGTGEQIKAQQTLAASYQQEITELQSLFARKLISKLQLDEAERDFLTVKTRIAELESAQAGLKVQIAEAREQLVLQENNYKKEVAAQLSETRAQIADLENRLLSASDRLQRTVVTAPMSGTVVSLAYHTQGGVVQAGSKILEIVPQTGAFEVEAQVNISDIDRVHIGQQADIRFPAFPSVSFLQVTPGDVAYVSADTLVDEVSGMQYYRAKVNIKPEGLAELQRQNLTLVQGMPAEVSIKAGERTFLDYLLKPIANMVTHAFNED